MYYLPTNAICKLHLSELHLYGAKRLGMRSSNLLVASTNGENSTQEVSTGEKRYELTNHLGNVLAVVSGNKATDGSAQILSLTDYYPFGMEMDGRKYSKLTADGGYRYGFNGYEKEFDLANDVYTTDYRLLDTRIGRWLSVDPLADKYAGMSPYNYCAGNPVLMMDPDGRDGYECTYTNTKGEETVGYVWIDNKSDKEFAFEITPEMSKRWNEPTTIDNVGSYKFLRITDDREKWNEATTIRKANIAGLSVLCPNINKEDIENDVRLYKEDNPLFTKESKLNNGDKYISGWEGAYNSETNAYDSFQSKEILETGFSLKFYNTKGGQKDVNSLGIIRSCLNFSKIFC